MKSNTDFIDSLIFVLFENNNSVKDFFIVYDKKLKKILPYVLPEEDQKENLAFQASSINLRDKNKYFVMHSSELPKDLFDKREFVYHVIEEATIQSVDNDTETREPFLDLDNFFEILKDEFRLNEKQLEKIYDAAQYYTDVNILYDSNNIITYEDYLEAIEYQTDKEFDEFIKFQEDVAEAILDMAEDPSIKSLNKISNSVYQTMNDNIKLAMIEHIKKNNNLIENLINDRIKKVISLLEQNKVKHELNI